MAILHIPDDVRFECTGCGYCCLSWPVPLTPADVQRLERLSPVDAGSSGEAPSMRRLNAGGLRVTGFTHSLEKRVDGKCQYLTAENRCSIHQEHGIEAKPSMCRLFPYTFNETPDGTHAYVSFASTGVLFNSGRLLSEQHDELQQQVAVYAELFAHVKPDWSGAQLVDGVPLAWSDYRPLREKMLATLRQDNATGTLQRLQQCSEIVASSLHDPAVTERMPPLESAPKKIDQMILAHLNNLYLPSDLFAAEADLDNRAIMNDLVNAPHVVQLATNGGAQRFGALAETTLAIPDEAEHLLRRFAYSRVFASLFFGPGFAHLSLLSGLHHLYFLIALVKLRAKCLQITKGTVEFLDVAELVQSMERRLTQVNLSAGSTAVLEVLLCSRARLERVAYLAR